MALTHTEVINRGTNMMPVAILAALGFGLLTVLVEESEWIDRAGDIVLFLIAIASTAWYFSGTNRFSRSYVPLALVVIALATKIGELGLEIGDPASVGDEFGVIPTLVLMIIFTAFAFKKAGKEIKGEAH